MNAAANAVMPIANFGVQTKRERSERKNSRIARLMNSHGAVSRLTKALSSSTIGRRLDRARDAAVLADAPEVDGHQDPGDERYPHAMQDVEPQQRALAD